LRCYAYKVLIIFHLWHFSFSRILQLCVSFSWDYL
jgi:hypothetical protein